MSDGESVRGQAKAGRRRDPPPSPQPQSLGLVSERGEGKGRRGGGESRATIDFFPTALLR